MQRALRLLIACACAVPFMLVGSSAGPAAAVTDVSGVVTDSTGTPIPGATVWLQQGNSVFRQLTTGDDGRYTIGGVLDGSWIIGAVAPGFAARIGNAADVAGATPVVVGADPVIFDVTLPRTNAAVSGTVTDPAGEPVGGAQIRIEPLAQIPFLPFGSDFAPYFRTGATGADGTYRFDGLAPTAFRVRIDPSDPGPGALTTLVGEFWSDAHQAADALAVMTFEGQETTGIDAQLDTGAVIAGRVTDASGTPVAGAFVTTLGFEGLRGASTASDGSYELVGVPSGDQWIVASVERNGTFQVAFYGGSTTQADATLLPITLGTRYDGIDIVLPDTGRYFPVVRNQDGTLASLAGTVACIAPGLPVVTPSPFPGFAPQVTCTSGPTNPSFVDGGVSLPVGTYNIAAQSGAGRFNVTEVELSDTVTAEITAAVPIDCEFVLGGAATCAPTDPATLDGDGVPASIEDAGPNGGDGNGDGVRDASQSNVASMPFAIGTGYATVVVPAPLVITRANLFAPSPPVFGAETGEFSVDVAGVPVGGTADITILRTSAGPATDLTTGPNVFNGPRRRIPAEFDGTTIVAHIVDGGPFDPTTNPVGTTPPDGIVRLSAVPSILDDVPPAITCASPAPTFTQGQFGFVTATVTDDLSGVVGPTTLSQFANTFAVGPNTVTFSASDVAGNRTTQACGYTVVAQPTDTTPPTIVCNSFGVPSFPVGSTASISAFASDDVALATPPLMSQQVDTSTPGTFSVLFTATDLAGNTAQQSCAYSVFSPDTIPPVVQCFGPGPYLVQAAPLSVFSFAFDETAPSFMFASATIDVSVEGTFTGTITATDAAGNVGSADCPYTVVSDFDDVPSAVEDGAPNGGDGNADGFPDRSQSDVASLVQADGSGYATVVDRSGSTLSSVTTEAFDGAALPGGTELLSATYVVRWNASFGNASLTLHGDPAFDTLLVRNPDGWVPSSGFVFDGDAADADGPGNGTVTARFAAANVDRTPPTVTCSDFTTYLLHQPGATVTVTASDDGSGVDTPVQTFAADTSVLGDGAVSVQIADRAGNVAQADCAYRVGVRISRLSSPRPGDVTTIQRGRVLAVRWTVTDFFGRGVADPAHFQSVDVEGGWTCPRGRTESGERTAPGLRYLGRGRWEYGWRAPSTPQCLSLELHVVGDARAALVRVR